MSELGIGIPPVIRIVVAIALSAGLSRMGSRPGAPVGAGRDPRDGTHLGPASAPGSPEG